MIMKESSANNEVFLAQWLAGELSDDQLRQLVSEADFDAYQKLRESFSAFEVGNPDMEQNYANIKQKKIAKLENKKSRVLPLFRYAAIAAMLVLFFGVYQMFVFSNAASTDFGKTAMVTLSDQSQVTLNAKSGISYPPLFRYNRTLKLDGEAYFEVSKGSTFTVETALGNVRVLGTKFNVISRGDFFEAVCYEGRVKVSNDNFCTILTKGEAIRFSKNKPENFVVKQQKPMWISGESDFRSVPLHYVIGALENQYHQKIAYPKQMTDVRFTGSFTHKDLAKAMQSVCIPLNLKYKETAPGKIVISE